MERRRRAAETDSIGHARIFHCERGRDQAVSDFDAAEHVVAPEPRIDVFAGIGEARRLAVVNLPESAPEVRRDVLVRETPAGRARQRGQRDRVRYGDVEDLTIRDDRPLAGLLEAVDRRADEQSASETHFAAAAVDAAAGMSENGLKAVLRREPGIAELREAGDTEPGRVGLRSRRRNRRLRDERLEDE